MFDKDLIERVCNLTCSKEDVCRDQTTIKYDSHLYDCAVLLDQRLELLYQSCDAFFTNVGVDDVHHFVLFANFSHYCTSLWAYWASFFRETKEFICSRRL